jgi:hypothetical protein
MTNNFNTKPNFPFTYSDDVANDGERLSDYIVNKLSDKKTQKYLGSVAVAAFALGTQIETANAIPADYGEAANNIINEAGKGGDCPRIPSVSNIQGSILDIPGARVPEGPRYYIPAMPIEQQHIIAAQQARHVSGPVKLPASPPVFWLPKKSMTDMEKFRSTMIFIMSTAGVCSQAGWNPIAQIMCASRLAFASFSISKPLFVAIFKTFAG